MIKDVSETSSMPYAVIRRTIYLPNKNHLLLEVALLIELGADLPVEVKHLFELLVSAWTNILDDWHKQIGLR